MVPPSECRLLPKWVFQAISYWPSHQKKIPFDLHFFDYQGYLVPLCVDTPCFLWVGEAWKPWVGIQKKRADFHILQGKRFITHIVTHIHRRVVSRWRDWRFQINGSSADIGDVLCLADALCRMQNRSFEVLMRPRLIHATSGIKEIDPLPGSWQVSHSISYSEL